MIVSDGETVSSSNCPEVFADCFDVPPLCDEISCDRQDDGSIDVTVTGSGASNYTWEITGGPSGSSQVSTFTIPYAEAGDPGGFVTVTSINAQGSCESDPCEFAIFERCVDPTIGYSCQTDDDGCLVVNPTITGGTGFTDQYCVITNDDFSQDVDIFLDGSCGSSSQGVDTITYCGVGTGISLDEGQLGNPNGAQLFGADILQFYSTELTSQEPGVPSSCSLVIEVAGDFDQNDLIVETGLITIIGGSGSYAAFGSTTRWSFGDSDFTAGQWDGIKSLLSGPFNLVDPNGGTDWSEPQCGTWGNALEPICFHTGGVKTITITAETIDVFGSSCGTFSQDFNCNLSALQLRVRPVPGISDGCAPCYTVDESWLTAADATEISMSYSDNGGGSTSIPINDVIANGGEICYEAITSDTQSFITFSLMNGNTILDDQTIEHTSTGACSPSLECENKTGGDVEIID